MTDAQRSIQPKAPKGAKPTYCLTVGDPSGIGPEITVKMLQDPGLLLGFNLCVLGQVDHLQETAKRLRMTLPGRDEGVSYFHIAGDVQHEPAAIAYMALDKAVEMIYKGLAKGLVTGPMSKSNLQQAGLPYSGHTEILERLARLYFRVPCRADMLFHYKAFRLLLLTRHVPLAQVSKELTADATFQALQNLVEYLRTVEGLPSPRLRVLGVNPHAGEIGGEEERNVLIPAIGRINSIYGLGIGEPVPADAAFRNFEVNNPGVDAVVATYHDQGLIPMKLLAGLKAVNITIGLPFIRTSVSHGMASDIVGKGIADPISMREALLTLDRLVSPKSAESAQAAVHAAVDAVIY